MSLRDPPIQTAQFDAHLTPPERLARLTGDVGAAQADILQRPVAEAAELAALGGPLLPAKQQTDGGDGNPLRGPTRGGVRRLMLSGTVRVGIPDDYAVLVLPILFSRFAESYPGIHLEVHCDSSNALYPGIKSGALDLAVLTEQDNAPGGRLLRQEPVVWATSRQHLTHRLDPLPLAIFPAPCIFRKWAMDELDAQGRPYRIAYSSRSMAAISVAVTAGLAIAPIARSSMNSEMRVLTEANGFPPLPEVRISLFRASNAADPAIARLIDHIVQSFQQELPATAAA